MNEVIQNVMSESIFNWMIRMSLIVIKHLRLHQWIEKLFGWKKEFLTHAIDIWLNSK